MSGEMVAVTAVRRGSRRTGEWGTQAVYGGVLYSLSLIYVTRLRNSGDLRLPCTSPFMSWELDNRAHMDQSYSLFLPSK